MVKKYYHIIAGLGYVQGHLRDGHLEGRVELTDEELAKLKKDPNFVKELGLNTIVDDWCVDDVGAVGRLTVVETDESGAMIKPVNMSKG